MPSRRTTLQVIFATAFMVWAWATWRMVYLMRNVKGGTRSMPDVWFGFTPAKLRQTCGDNVWGAPGRAAYLQAAAVDLFPYMQAYTVALWCCATILTRRQRLLSWRVAGYVLATVPVVFDVLETTNLRAIVQQDCQVSDEWIQFTSMVNQIKWSIILVFVIILVPQYYLTRRNGRHLDKEEEVATKKE